MSPFRDRAAKFNAPGQSHNNVFVSPRIDTVPLRYPDFSETGFVLQRSRLRYQAGQGPDGQLRLDLHERLATPDGDLVFHRGGFGYVDGENVKYGHVSVRDLVGPLPRPVPSGGGRGAPSRAAQGPLYTPGYLIRVRQIPNAMLYKRPSDPPAGQTKVGSKWMHYADPGSGQGDRHDIHYSVMTWSWLNVRGGGMNRALTHEDQIVHRCDVDSITYPAWDEFGNRNGEVVGIYIKTRQGGNWLYGWAVHSHRFFSDGVGGKTIFHVEQRP
jgi:hypothetical protein